MEKTLGLVSNSDSGAVCRNNVPHMRLHIREVTGGFVVDFNYAEYVVKDRRELLKLLETFLK